MSMEIRLVHVMNRDGDVVNSWYEVREGDEVHVLSSWFEVLKHLGDEEE